MPTIRAYSYVRSANASESPNGLLTGSSRRLTNGGYITRERNGRRNHYTIQSGLPLPDRLGRVQRISDLLTILIGTGEEMPNTPVRTPSKSSKANKSASAKNGNAGK